MAEEEKKEEGTEEEGEQKKGKGKLLLIIGVVIILLASAGVSSMLLLGGEEPEGGEHGEEEHEEQVHYETFELDTIIVNLSKSNSFLKVKMLIEFDPTHLHGDDGHGGGGAYGGGGSGGGDAAPAGLPGVLGEKEPMIRDAIIRVLSSKTAEQILTVEGKEELKEELVEAINEMAGLDEGPVVAVYFMEFIVQ